MNKWEYIVGAVLGVIFLVISYLIARFVFGYLSWAATGLALVLPLYAFYAYMTRVDDRSTEISRFVKISFSGSLVFLVSSWACIQYFAPFLVADIGDVVLRYIYTLRMAGAFLVVFLIAGALISNRPHS
ncbi:hypothetical protein EN829_051940 [Mesorhizobium sp. M00.F.Ca.ET.186.01.1.1]|nr:hypothetical protein EN829_051940 [Mesorhizobium sp. M00.F.Ca.ET.186.01.1.1]